MSRLLSVATSGTGCSVASRASNAARLRRLEAFVRAWDEYIGLAQRANTMNPEADEFAHVVERQRAKMDVVNKARRAIGVLDG